MSCRSFSPCCVCASSGLSAALCLHPRPSQNAVQEARRPGRQPQVRRVPFGARLFLGSRALAASPRCPEPCLRRPGPAFCAPHPEPCASRPPLRVTLLGTRARVAAGTSLCSSLVLSTQEPSGVAGGHLPRSRPGWCTGAPSLSIGSPPVPVLLGGGRGRKEGQQETGTHGPASRVSLQQDNAI